MGPSRPFWDGNDRAQKQNIVKLSGSGGVPKNYENDRIKKAKIGRIGTAHKIGGEWAAGESRGGQGKNLNNDLGKKTAGEKTLAALNAQH